MADKVRVRVDTSELVAALKAYEKHSSRSMPAIINGTAIDVAFKANRAAKKARGEDMMHHQNYINKMFHALATMGNNKFGPTPKGKGNQRIAERIAKDRYDAIGYTKALFLKLAKDLGKNLRASVGRTLPSNADGQKAKEAFVCFAILTINGIEKRHADEQVQPALQKGVDLAAKAKRDRIAKKLAEGARKYSGRKAR